MTALEIIKGLVERFQTNLQSYSSSSYNETLLRREFLDPFFEALGWDVANKQGYAEAYKEVIHEDAVKIGAVTKAPDYSFRIGGIRKFFVEAKKPFVNIQEDVNPAFQLRRYAWSGKLPLSILTDFEEFAVYDCRIKPNKTDKASVGRILYIRFDEYEKRWNEIAAVFSKEAILKGSFDKYAEGTKGKKGTSEVDDEFLGEIERWRDMLARNIAIRNPDLSQRELNFAVQRTIDRIIFLRICEDRGIEQYGSMMALLNGEHVYKRMRQNFQRADEIYNSGLFHFREEKGRAEPPDKLTLTLQIDDKPLKEIIENLYYPESPYEFSVLPADILGQVYEQFLGKVIRLTAGHQARVDDKPEVKKAGGVFYTPTYIVDYIAKNTVGKLVENKTPKQIEKLKILDPACGSGSFLIQAYQYLLDYHRDWYIKDGIDKNTKGKVPKLTKLLSGEWRLSTSERKKILLNNIHGVDIDSQAVEVTKLSLLLKVLEGENEQSIAQQMSLWHERALPDLENNIKCGNSLIGTDYFHCQGVQETMVFYYEGEEDERMKINAFDWDGKDGFPEIMKNGGFDVVIGNPPWGSLITLNEKSYLYSHYANKKGEAESHLFFIEKGFSLLNRLGRLGFITPNTWLTIKNAQELRAYLLDKTQFYSILELTKYIFNNAPDIVPIVIVLGKSDKKNTNCKVYRTTLKRIDSGNFSIGFVAASIDSNIWVKSETQIINLRLTKNTNKLVDKIYQSGIRLGNICNVQYGIKTGDNSRFLSKQKTATHTVKALKTGEISRYKINWKSLWLYWCKDLAGYRSSSVEVPKIIIQYIRKLSLQRRIIASLDKKGIYYPLNNYSYITALNNEYPLEYILGIIASKLINYYFANTFIDYNIKPTYLQQIPIRSIDFSNERDKSYFKRINTLVFSIIALNQEINSAKTDHEKTILHRQIESIDRRIDELVYQLYGLTDEEIKIVEGASEGK